MSSGMPKPEHIHSALGSDSCPQECLVLLSPTNSTISSILYMLSVFHCFHFFHHQHFRSLICPTLFIVPLSVWVDEAAVLLFWHTRAHRLLQSGRIEAPQDMQELRNDCHSHSPQSRGDAVPKLILSPGENSTAPEILKLAQNGTLQFLYETTRIKGTADTKIPYCLCQHEFRARTDKFPSKAILRRHLQKHFGTSCAHQSLLKRLAQVCKPAGHTITFTSLPHIIKGMTQEHSNTNPGHEVPRIQQPGRRNPGISS